MIRLLIALFLITPLALQADDEAFYKITDAEGNITLSDTPGGESSITESITIKQPTTVSAVPLPHASFIKKDTSPKQKNYQSLTISSPAEGQTLPYSASGIRVNAQLTPALKKGHRIIYTFDGAPITSPAGSNSALITEAYRGEHTVSAKAINAAGQALISSPPRHFFIFQQSRLNK